VKSLENTSYLSASAVVIHYEEALSICNFTNFTLVTSNRVSSRISQKSAKLL